MPKFIQLHFLTTYPVSNPNRDDLGRPKSAQFGGVNRLRISSQALKRAARMSSEMQEALTGHMGDRTQRIGQIVHDALIAQNVSDDKAKTLATQIMAVFGKVGKKVDVGKLQTEQLAFVSPDEKAMAIELACKAAQGEDLPKDKDLAKLVLRPADGAVDIAMFGRMLADAPEYNREAAVQVSHAITTHRAEVEDDYYVAADDLKTKAEDAGAGFVGEAGFGSGVFYTYTCIDRDLLIENLGGDKELALKGARAFAKAMATSTPSGKKNSFAHQTRACFVRAEADNIQPRSLAGAFFKPVAGTDLEPTSIEALEHTAAKMDKAYDAVPADIAQMNAVSGEGSFADILALIDRAFEDA